MSNFEIIGCVRGSQILGSNNPNAVNTFRVTANHPFRDRTNTKLLDQAVTLERSLVGNGLEIIEARHERDPRSMWLVRPFTTMPRAGLSTDQLNQIIERSPAPSVRIVESDQYPGLITAHRSLEIGKIALAAVRQSDTLQTAMIIPTGSHARELPNSLYADGTLLMAVVDPSVAEVSRATRDIRDILTA